MNAANVSPRFRSRLSRAAILVVCVAVFDPSARAAPIHEAAEKGDLAKVVALLKEDPDLVASRDKLGNTPLHLAALHDQVAVAELLLANGADVNAENTANLDNDGMKRSGETPLTLALLSYHHKQMLDLLLTHGADVNVMIALGVTPLSRAIERDLSSEDVELLLANGADPNRKGFNWNTPVHLAVMRRKPQLLRLLLDYGGDPNAKNSAGFTPMFFAEATSNAEAIALLRAHGGHR